MLFFSTSTHNYCTSLECGCVCVWGKKPTLEMTYKGEESWKTVHKFVENIEMDN